MRGGGLVSELESSPGAPLERATAASLEARSSSCCFAADNVNVFSNYLVQFIFRNSPCGYMFFNVLLAFWSLFKGDGGKLL